MNHAVVGIENLILQLVTLGQIVVYFISVLVYDPKKYSPQFVLISNIVKLVPV